MHIELQLLHLDDRRELQKLQLCHKNIHTIGTLSKFFKMPVNARGTTTRTHNKTNMTVPAIIVLRADVRLVIEGQLAGMAYLATLS